MIVMGLRRQRSQPAGMLTTTVPVGRDFFKERLSRKFISSGLNVNCMADSSLLFIVVSVVILFIIGLLLVIGWKKKTGQPHSPLSMVGMVLVILGIVFGSDHLIGYSFLGAGVLVAAFDLVKNRKKK